METRLNQVLLGKEDNYILPFFWQHGEDEVTLRHYMKIIHESNIHAVCVESRPHPDFAGPGWWHDMDIIIDEAKKRSMKVWILDDEHFPTGYAAGALKNAPLTLHHQYLDYYRLDVCGPMPQAQVVIDQYIHPAQMPEWEYESNSRYEPLHDDHLYKVIACPVITEGKLGVPTDLTPLVNDGILEWDVPEGYYLIFILYLTRDANGRNNYINFIDRDSCRLLIDAVYEPHWAHYADEFGKTIAGFFSDEPTIGNSPGYTDCNYIGKTKQPLPWSDAVPVKMKEAFGTDDWYTYLPYLWMEAQDGQSRARIRTVYMDVLSKLVQECFSDQVGHWCEEHGVEYIGHIMEGESSHLGPNLVHFYRAMAGQHMSGIDNIGNCILIGGQEVMRSYTDKWRYDAPFWHYAFAKMGTAQAALDPKKKGRCMCENFGAYGWEAGVKSFKYYMDFFLVRGVNHYVPHAFSPKTFPDPDCPPHFYAHGENPQYKAFGELMAYSNRVCHLINGGVSHPTAAIMYHGENDWAGTADNCAYAAKALVTSQIDFHVLWPDVYTHKEEFRTRIENGVFEVNGYRYQALILPGCEYLYKDTADFAYAVHKAGIPVYLTGEFPKGISNCTPEESAAYTEKLKSFIFAAPKDLPKLLSAAIQPEISLKEPYPNLTCYHYTTDCDTFLFLNEDPAKTFTGQIRIKRQKPSTPYLYDAWENRIYSLAYEQDGEMLTLSPAIQPLDMIIITFDQTITDAVRSIPDSKGQKILFNCFDISLAEATDYPHFTATDLHDSHRSISRVYPDFSGWIRYETSFDFWDESCENALLLIDDVYESAEVFINDIYVGTRISKPYRFDILKALQHGKNTLRIDVATTLRRKLRGIRDDFSHGPLAPTGIIGDVSLFLH